MRYEVYFESGDRAKWAMCKLCKNPLVHIVLIILRQSTIEKYEWLPR